MIGDTLTESFAATFSDMICRVGGGGREGIREKPRSCVWQGHYKSKHLHATQNFMLINTQSSQFSEPGADNGNKAVPAAVAIATNETPDKIQKA